MKLLLLHPSVLEEIIEAGLSQYLSNYKNDHLESKLRLCIPEDVITKKSDIIEYIIGKSRDFGMYSINEYLKKGTVK